MRVGICDDEKIFLDQFLRYVKSCMPYVEENFGSIGVDFFHSGEELLESYKDGSYFDILFLDIRMNRLNGFETAKQIRLYDNKVIIIFVTSLVDYVFKSFEYKPFWYLTKPVSEDSFKSVLYKALTEVTSLKTNEYCFKNREEGLERVHISNIIYLESLTRQIRLHTTQGDYFFYASITKEEDKLKPLGFLRTHKSYLVNLLFFQQVQGPNLKLKTGQVLPISERRYKSVYDAFTHYLARSSIL